VASPWRQTSRPSARTASARRGIEVEKSSIDLQWEYADHDSIEQASAIETAIEFAHGEATSDWKQFSDDFRETLKTPAQPGNG
jgi:hypothetical protein